MAALKSYDADGTEDALNDLGSMARLEKPRTRQCVLVANFTVEPIRQSLEFWFDKFGWQIDLHFAPYDQVIQYLLRLDEGPAHESNFVIIFIQLERWVCPNGASPEFDSKQRGGDFHSALASAIKRMPETRFLVLLCPSSANATISDIVTAGEKQLVQSIRELPGAAVFDSCEMRKLYPSSDAGAFFDAYTNKLGQIPYSSFGFANLATMGARWMYGCMMRARKVIVVDCDNTLWSGVCSEKDGTHLEIDLSRRLFQEFLIAQVEGGRLLCLCSKNDPDDVFDVFSRNQGMLLRPEHLAAWKINWDPKPENLQLLSSELSLGLDSFIFIDDDSFECGVMQSMCPEVLTIQLPANSSGIEPLLRNIWDLDLRSATVADHQRTRYYQQEGQREESKRKEPSLHEFLESLQLSVDLRALTVESVSRAAQLTERTNQFNLNGIRRTINELHGWLDDNLHQCLLVSARDRFGDYGDIGLIKYHIVGDEVRVETFVLSCRALGRGVEVYIARQLADVWSSSGVSGVRFDYQATGKNHAAYSFLIGLGMVGQSGCWSVALDRLRHEDGDD